MSNTSSLIWMFHDEGFCALLLRFAFLYELLLNSNRTVVFSSYHGAHYADIKAVSLCQYFEFPSIFECRLNTTRQELQTMVQARNLSCLPYRAIEHDDPVALKAVGCLDSVPIGNPNTFPWDFTPYSKTLLSTGRSLLALHGCPLIVFHWRRGDQLTSRCVHNDHSLNCGTVEAFIDDVDSRVSLFKSDQMLEHVRVYIATDESHSEAIHKLDDRGYNHSMQLVTEARTQNVTLNSADSILIDLMLMCVADLFIHYGQSSSVNFVAAACRRTHKLVNASDPLLPF